MGGFSRWTVRDPDGGVRFPDGWVRALGTGGAIVLLLWGLAARSAGTYPGILRAMPEQMLIVDAVEGDVVRAEFDGGRMLDLPAAWLPAGIAEGQVVRVEASGDGRVSFTVDEHETELRRRENQALMDSIIRKPPEDFHI